MRLCGQRQLVHLVASELGRLLELMPQHPSIRVVDFDRLLHVVMSHEAQRAACWRGSAKAIDRLNQAKSEIRAVNRADRVTAAEGVVVLAERIWPPFEQIDTSSGALGSAVRQTLEDLVPVLIAAPADEPTRAH